MRLTIIALICLLATSCASLSAESKAAMQTFMAVNKGHMADDTLPEEARLIAQDNYDAFAQVLHAEADLPLPADTAERMAARKAEKESKDEAK